MRHTSSIHSLLSLDQILLVFMTFKICNHIGHKVCLDE
jgi:hypothetical protein